MSLGIASIAHGQVSRPYSNEFLKIGVGAKYMGLGTSLASSRDDIASVFYNPSAITELPSISIGAMHNSYFAGIANFDYLGAIFPIHEDHRLGASFIRFGVDDIPNTLQLYNPDGSINYDNIESFSIADMALFLTYARKIGFSGVSLGGNTKIVFRNYGRFANAFGFGIDLGAQWVRDNFQLGIFAQDLTTTFSIWSFHFTEEDKKVLTNTGNEIPSSSNEITLPSFHFGGQYTFGFIKNNLLFTPSAKISLFPEKRNVLLAAPVSVDLTFGLEISFWDLVRLRTGVYNFTRPVDYKGDNYLSVVPSIGLGLSINRFQIDYSYNNIANAGIGLYSHVFSASYSFKPKEVKDYRPSPPPIDINDRPSFDPNDPMKGF